MSFPPPKQSSQRFEPVKEEDSRKWERSADRKKENSPGRVTQSSVGAEHVRGRRDKGAQEMIMFHQNRKLLRAFTKSPNGGQLRELQSCS